MTYARLGTAAQFAVICWLMLFWRLGHVGLMDDEAHYARLTVEMVAQQSWLLPLLGGQPFIDKPVLFHWVQALASAVSGSGEMSARLPSAVAAVLLLLITAWVGRRVADPWLGRGAWLMLITVPATFFLGRTGYMDMMFTAFTFGAVALIISTTTATSRLAATLATVCVALAVLTKGPVAAGLVGLWLVLAWLLGGDSRRAVSALPWKRGLLGIVVLAAPWFVWMYAEFGDAFVRGYFFAGHTDYLTPRASASSTQWTFYARMFMTAFFPWSLVAIGYGADTVLRRRRGVTVPVWEVWLWLWIAVVLAVFTAVSFRVDRYIYPAAPACCLLAIRGWLAAAGSSNPREFACTRAAVFVTGVVLAAAGASLAWAMPSLSLNLPVAAYVLPAVLSVGGLAMMASLLRRGGGLPRFAGWPIGTLLAAYICAAMWGLPAVRAGLPVDVVGRFVAKHAALGEPVGLLGMDRWEMGLRYYLTDLPERLQNAREAGRFACAPGPRWMVTRREWYDAIASGGGAGTVALSVPAILGTKGRGLRTQIWGDVLVLRFDSACTSPTPPPLPQP